MTKGEFDQIILEQIKKGGMGSELFLEAEEHNNSIRLQNLVKFIYT